METLSLNEEAREQRAATPFYNDFNVSPERQSQSPNESLTKATGSINGSNQPRSQQHQLDLQPLQQQPGACGMSASPLDDEGPEAIPQNNSACASWWKACCKACKESSDVSD